MISLFSRWLKFTGAGLLLALAGVTPTTAKTLDIPAAAAHLDLPGDWTIENRNDIALYAVTDSGSSVTVTLFTNDNGQGAEKPQFMKNLEMVLRQRASKEKASVKIVNGGTTDLNGIPADFIQAELAFPEGGVAYARSYGLAENKSILVLTLMTRDSSEAADAGLQTIAKSLRFDHAPAQPGDNLWTNYHLGWILLAVVVGGALLLFGLSAVPRRRDAKCESLGK